MDEEQEKAEFIRKRVNQQMAEELLGMLTKIYQLTAEREWLELKKTEPEKDGVKMG